MYRKVLLLMLLALAGTQLSYGQGFRPVVKDTITNSNVIINLPGSGYSDTINRVENAYYDQLKGNPSPANLTFKTLRDYIKLGVRHDTAVIDTAYKYAVTIQIIKFIPIANAPDTSIDDSKTIVMELEYDPDSLQPYKDVDIYQFTSCHSFEIVVRDISDITSGTPIAIPRSQLARNFYIESGIITQRYDYLATTPIYFYPSSSVNGEMLTVSWNTSTTAPGGSCPSGSTAEIQPTEYELEWTYIDDYRFDLANDTSANAYAGSATINYDFKNNASRVRLQNNSYEIPLIYEQGAIVFRLRTVRPNDSTKDYEGWVYGDWNLPDQGSVSSSESCKVYVITSAHENDEFNWQYTINFAEEGKYKHVINYFDGALKNRQTQTKINTDDNYIIAVDRAFDFEGNKSIESLPIPVLQNDLGYLSNVMNNSATSAQYEPADFDSLSCSIPDSFPGLSNSSKGKIYYSSYNSDTTGMQKFVPDANGYPFTQSVYSPDKLLLWQTGAGDKHQAWTGHATRYEYSRANQGELDNLFGYEAGKFQYYPKIITTDANGQTSFTIQNMSGQSIATGLIGLPDTGATPLKRIVTADTTLPFCFNVLGDGIQDRLYNGLAINTKYYVEKNASHSLQYKLKIPGYPTGCSGKYIWARASYNYSARDECGAPVISETTGVLGYDSVTSSGNAQYLSSPVNDEFLQKGNITIDKRLTFNKYEINNRVKQFVKDHENNTSSCFYDEKWYVRKSIEQAEFPCIDSGVLGPCELKKRQMMSELWPNAKYGVYNKNGKGGILLDTLICNGIQYVTLLGDHRDVANSIFQTYQYDTVNCSEGGYIPLYKSYYQYPCFDMPDTVIKNGVIYTNIQSLPIDTFIYIFNDEIAEALLPIHPEYCKLGFCDDGGYIKELEQITTSRQAEITNRFELDSIIIHDPLYVNAATAQKTVVQYRLAHFENYIHQTIDEMAIEQAYCSAGNVFEAEHCKSYIYKNEINDFDFLDSNVKQKYYEVMKGFYLINRSLYLQKKIDSVNLVDSGNCSSCPVIELIEPSVFTSVFNNDGSFDSSLNIPTWIDTLFRNVYDQQYDWSTLVTPPELVDSINSIKSNIDSARVLAIVGNLGNCSTLQADIDDIKNEILDLLSTGLYSLESPETIDSAIKAAGVPLTDLCNGYIPNLKAFNTTNDIEYPYDCKAPDYYEGIESFFSRSDVINAIKNTVQSGGTVYGFNLDGDNSFENEIAVATYIGMTDSVTIQGFLDTIEVSQTDYISYLKIEMKGYSSDSIAHLYLYNKEAGDTTIHGDPSLSLLVNDAICINNDNNNSLSTGKLGKGTAIIEFERDDGVNNELLEFYLWSRDVEFMNAAEDKLPINCITCIDVKEALKNFEANYDTGNINGFNHPLIEKHLTNYLNATLNTKYTYTDYRNLMEACALSDSIDFKRYFATVSATCSTATLANNLVASINSYTSRKIVDFRIDYTGGNSIVAFDLGILPHDSLLSYKYDVVDMVTAAGCVSSYLPEEPLMVFIESSCTPDTAIASYGTVTDSSLVTLVRNGTSHSGKLYAFSDVYADAFDHAELLADIYAEAEECSESFVIADGELLRGEDYGSTYSDAYLAYLYSLDTLSRYQIRDSIDTDNLMQVIDSFSGKSLQYIDPYCFKPIRDLYVFEDDQSSHTGYTMLSSILDSVIGILGSDKLFLPEYDLSDNNGSDVYVFRKASDVHWFRYFDGDNNLYNVHLEPPKNAPFDINTLQLDSLSVGPGSDSIYRFTAYMHYSALASEVVVCRGYTDFPVGYGKRLGNVVLYDYPGLDFCLDSFDCEYVMLQDAIQSGKVWYRQAYDSSVSAITDDMFAYLLDNTKDTLYFCAQNQKNMITLYYYDLNGNLRKTVPPAGVKQNPTVGSQHTKVTEYKYNSRNQVIWQKTPDGGETEFYYDGAGRLVFSRNDEQKYQSRFSYTLYDDLSRPIETGEVVPPSVLSPPNSPLPTYVVESYKDNLYPMDTLIKYVRLRSRFDVVRTTYDTARVGLDTVDIGVTPSHLSKQTNLMNRVSSIAWYKAKGPDYVVDNQTPHFTTHYSYDMVGNVKTITYDCLLMEASKNRYKRVDYDYDQLSGKVNMITYNRSKADQFYQRYEYDADNRIIKAESSNDGFLWNRDASYEYYKHGPLAQVRLGDAQIQSLEYAYTIQGWLKAINGDVLRPDKKMIADPLIDSVYARDVVAHAINYFDGDYDAITTGANVTNFPSTDKDLYNGNITRTNTAIRGLGNQRGTYKYDQAHRLTNATYETIDESNMTVNTPSDIYKNTYKYDYDGNIEELVRYDGNATVIDSMVYHYTAGTNQLDYVDDQVSTTGGEDFQPNQTVANYRYDSLGNLTDDAQANLKMEWTLYGKLKTVEHLGTTPLEKNYYYYDGLGNRFMKKMVKTVSGSGDLHQGEYYVRDATGNILAVYNFHSVFDRIKVISVANSGVHANGAFASFVNSIAGAEATYIANFVDDAINDELTWVESQTDEDISFYLSNDASLYSEILTGENAPDYLNDMQAYSAANVGMELFAYPLNDDEDEAAMIMDQVLGYETECKKMFEHFDQQMPSTDLDNMWTTLSVGSTREPDHADNATTLYDFMVLNGKETEVLEEMVDLIGDNNSNNNGTESKSFYAAMIHDDAIFESTNLRNAGGDPPPPPTDFETGIQDILYGHAQMNNVNQFFDQWGSSDDWLDSNTTLDHRMQVVYSANPDVVLADYINTVSDAKVIDTLLAGIEEISAYEYFNARANGPYATSLGTLNAQQLYTYGTAEDTTHLAEHHIYGSSRLAVHRYPDSLLVQTYTVDSGAQHITSLSDGTIWYSYTYKDYITHSATSPYGEEYEDTLLFDRTVGYRNYEMTDHLGNVLATVLDRRTGHDTGGANYDYWMPDMTSIQDYYPFGMRMGDRHAEVSDSTCRFGFNGKENDNEVYGVNKFQDYGMRRYNPLIARFVSVDPLTKSYPELTPYQFAGNTPIQAIDLDGAEPFFMPGMSAWRITPQVGLLSENEIIVRPVTAPQTGTGPRPVTAPRFSPKQLENFARGKRVEAEQLQKMGLEKNTKPFEVEVDGKPTRTIPDAMRKGPNGGDQTVDVKNVKQQSLSRQLKAQREVSNGNGERPVLRINKDARISKPVEESFDIEFYNMAPVDNVRHTPTEDPTVPVNNGKQPDYSDGRPWL